MRGATASSNLDVGARARRSDRRPGLTRTSCCNVAQDFTVSAGFGPPGLCVPHCARCRVGRKQRRSRGSCWPSPSRWPGHIVRRESAAEIVRRESAAERWLRPLRPQCPGSGAAPPASPLSPTAMWRQTRPSRPYQGPVHGPSHIAAGEEDPESDPPRPDLRSRATAAAPDLTAGLPPHPSRAGGVVVPFRPGRNVAQDGGRPQEPRHRIPLAPHCSPVGRGEREGKGNRSASEERDEGGEPAGRTDSNDRKMATEPPEPEGDRNGAAWT